MMWGYGASYPMIPIMMPLVMLGIAAVYLVFLVAAWRLMKAHESLALSLKEIAQNLGSKPD